MVWSHQMSRENLCGFICYVPILSKVIFFAKTYILFDQPNLFVLREHRHFKTDLTARHLF